MSKRAAYQTASSESPLRSVMKALPGYLWRQKTMLGLLALTGFVIYMYIVIQDLIRMVTPQNPISFSDITGGGIPIEGTGTPRYDVPDHLKTIITEAPVPTDAPTPKPTPAPTGAPTFPKLENFISFIGNDDQSIVKYDFENKQVGWEFNVGTIILSYSLTSDDSAVLVGCIDNSVKYISMSDFGGSLIYNLTGHTGSVGATAVKDGKGLTGSDGGECKYWDLTTGDELSTFLLGEPVVDIDFIGDYAIICSGTEVFLWKIKNGNSPLEFPILERTYPVSEKFGIPKFVRSFTDYKFVVGTNEDIIVYSVTQTAELGSFSKTFLDTQEKRDQGYNGYFNIGNLVGLAVNPINEEAATIYEGNKIIIVNLLTLKVDPDNTETNVFLMATNSAKNHLTMSGSTATRRGIDYSKDGKYLTGAGIVWNRNNGSFKEYTCPDCETECSCLGLGCVCGLSKEPKFSINN